MLLRILSSHCSGVPSDLGLGLPLEEDWRFFGVTGLPPAGMMLILEAPPAVCFATSCENGFSEGMEASGELEMLILGFDSGSCSAKTGVGGASAGEGCETTVVLVLPSPSSGDWVEA